MKIDDGERKCADDRSCLRTDNGPAPAMKPQLCAHRMRFSLRMRNRLRLAAAVDVTAGHPRTPTWPRQSRLCERSELFPSTAAPLPPSSGQGATAACGLESSASASHVDSCE